MINSEKQKEVKIPPAYELPPYERPPRSKPIPGTPPVEGPTQFQTIAPSQDSAAHCALGSPRPYGSGHLPSAVYCASETEGGGQRSPSAACPPVWVPPLPSARLSAVLRVAQRSSRAHADCVFGAAISMAYQRGAGRACVLCEINYKSLNCLVPDEGIPPTFGLQNRCLGETQQERQRRYNPKNSGLS